MRIFDLLSLIVYNLKRRMGRVVLTATGVVIGTASVVILVSLANGLQRSATSQFGGNSDLTLIQVSQKWEEPVMGPGGGMVMSGPSKMKQLTEGALAEMRDLPNVVSVIPRDFMMSMAIMKYGRLETYPNITGFGVADMADLGYEMKSGSSKLERGSALVGPAVLRSFNDPKIRPGQEMPPEQDLQDQLVKLVLVKWSQDGTEIKKTVSLRIAGVLAENRSETDFSVIVSMDDLKAWNEWSTGTRINRNRDGYSNVMVKVNDVSNVLTVTDQINEMGFAAYTQQDTVQGVSNFYMIVQVIFGGVGAVALLVAAIGIANTMTMAILERTREIGLMKAIGATNRNVLSIFLGEAAGIGFVGGLGGVALGLLIGEAINIVTLPALASQAALMGSATPNSVVYTPPWLPVFAIAFATLIGLFSGLYPALRAATLVPVIALKYE